MRSQVSGQEVIPGREIKYLGVNLDKNLSFVPHILRVANKAKRLVAALSRLMPNIGGPRSCKRRLLGSVVHSTILYAAPVRETALARKGARQLFSSLQRSVALRVASAYRTVSEEAALVLAGIPRLTSSLPSDPVLWPWAQVGNAQPLSTRSDAEP